VIGRGVAGRITLAGRSRCFPWMFKRERRQPKTQVPTPTWAPSAFSAQEDCAVVNSDRPLKIQNQEAFFRATRLGVLHWRGEALLPIDA